MSIDASIRQRALAPDRSFIVQAPAGSGKTSLLVQRYLQLLATVDAPEEILAITFTRKAAAEMRGRILDWLAKAQNTPEPNEDHLRQSWNLGRLALSRDEAQGWNLPENPNRMRVLTVDAFNSLLAAQMPILSKSGARVPVVDDAEFLYREAARRFPQALGSDDPGAKSLEVLLRHLDNNVARLEELMVTMLACRDHWLSFIWEHRNQTGQESRPLLEAGFARLIEGELKLLEQCFSHSLLDAMTELAGFAYTQLDTAFRSPINGTQLNLTQRLTAWKQMSSLFLTQRGAPRKSFTKTQGFSTDFPLEKERAKDLSQELSRHPDVCKRLAVVMKLPEPHYRDRQWPVLMALLDVLPLAAAQLKIVFRERRQMDFIGVSEAALSALGAHESPTDLALALDYRIRHILIDEFQDTSYSQYELLLLLTAGWQPDDGRSFFCVGDPMQSIYRFRQAEVGLFLRATREGFPHLPLEALRLTSNFRSDGSIVKWVNGAFKQIFPENDDLDTAGVSHVASYPERPALESDAITIHPFLDSDRIAESVRVQQVTQTLLRLHPEDSLAILVSSRLHLAEIIPLLKQINIRFQAVEIDTLESRPVIGDLLALTRALLSHGHRTAWLSILRAPWCGLTLGDLHRLVVDKPRSAPIWDLLQKDSELSGDGGRRLHRFKRVLGQALVQKGRVPLAALVEQTWIALGGPACLSGMDELVDVRVFFDLLESQTVGEELPDNDQMEYYLGRLFAAPDPKATEQVQVMTIHRAKGLEFDSVILPGLGRATSGDDAKLLRWLEMPRENNRRDLLLAPVGSSGDNADPMHEYLRQVEKERDRHEQARLLYVATTRAKKRLHILGNTTVNEKQNTLRPPHKGSLLRRLWPVVESRFQRTLARRSPQLELQPHLKLGGANELRRLVSHWSMPQAQTPASVDSAHLEPNSSGEISFHWVGNTARHVGSVVHLFLQQIATDGVEQWPAERIDDSRWAMAAWLQRFGINEHQMDQAIRQVQEALKGSLADERGRWILSSDHSERHNEYPLTGLFDGHFRSVVLDRTFVDQEGTRWIIDYKTSRHEGPDVDAFLDNEKLRYEEQMSLYGQLMRKVEARPIRLALYFPLLAGWRAWDL